MKDLFGNVIARNYTENLPKKRRFEIWRQVNNMPLTIRESEIRYVRFAHRRLRLTVSNQDLFTFLLRDPDKASKLTFAYDDFAEIALSDISELRKAAELTEREAQLICLAFELGRRLLEAKSKEVVTINSDKDAYNAVKAYFEGLDHEELLLVTLGTKNQIIRKHLIFKGGLNAALFQTHTILRKALQDNAAAILIAHNHPSGDPSPSSDDITATKSLAIGCKSIQVRLIDHIIIGSDGQYLSMMEQQII